MTTKVLRVLKDDGMFLYITYRQPHFIKPILNRANEWDMNMEYFGFVLKKNNSG
jgi:hypothetical protein